LLATFDNKIGPLLGGIFACFCAW
jgi:hypothetical protein